MLQFHDISLFLHKLSSIEVHVIIDCGCCKCTTFRFNSRICNMWGW